MSATTATPDIAIRDLSKTYATGRGALKSVNLDIAHGEIFALLGPNGAGKTTLISIICGIVTASQGTVSRRRRGKSPSKATTSSATIAPPAP